MEKEQIVVIVSSILSTGILNIVLTHILHSQKLKKEQKVRSENVIWDKVAEAVDAVRDIELKCRVIELYKAEEVFSGEKYAELLHGGREVIYLAVMEDAKTFCEFGIEVNDARGKWGRYLDPKTNAFLLYMQNYTMQLMDFMKKEGLTDYQLAGTVFICDIQNWQRELEKILVKKINKPKYKVYIENGLLWKYNKKKVMKKMWNKSILKALIEGKKDKRTRLAKEILNSSLNEGEEIEASK